MKPTIKWNADLFGVEIQTEDEHFVISATPSMAMDWNEAVRYFKGNEEWAMPTKKQLQIVAEYIDKVNAPIKDNGGYELRGWFWTADECDEFCAWVVRMLYGSTSSSHKYLDYCVRAVSAFQD